MTTKERDVVRENRSEKDAVPEGFCGNLTNALKSLANRRGDGDGLIQNIVTNLGERSRQGITHGLREFIKIDNQRAPEVGYLSKGMGKFKVRRPKGSESCLEVTARESPDELTLRAENVGTWKRCINVDHIKKDRWGHLLVDYDWYAFSQALSKGIEGEDWGDMYDAYKEMSRAVGLKKPQEAQKAKALWNMKAAKDAGEEYYDATREDNI